LPIEQQRLLTGAGGGCSALLPARSLLGTPEGEGLQKVEKVQKRDERKKSAQNKKHKLMNLLRTPDYCASMWRPRPAARGSAL
jgi:hypothetical protein